MSATRAPAGRFFQRFILPGLAFKAVVIGGGYATGREIAEFFLGGTAREGLYGMLLAMAIWSLVCALAFLFARRFQARDYRTFFRALLGRFWPLFEITFVLFMILVLSVMAAAAGSIGAALFGWHEWSGTLVLIVAIVTAASFGTEGVERLFRYSSAFIYMVYALFLILAVGSFGDRILPQLAEPAASAAWIGSGATYASYNVVAAVIILPFLRHQIRDRDAILAGLLSGPLAILPAFLFFLCMVAWHPEIGGESLPSDFLLRQIGLPWFHYLFQAMIFCALLETGVGMVNSINERVAETARGAGYRFDRTARLGLSALLVVGAGLAASRFGLVALIAQGYGAFGHLMLAIFILPLATIGVARLIRSSPKRGGKHAPTAPIA
jgi:uncharacterized membrane protein YkvI